MSLKEPLKSDDVEPSSGATDLAQPSFAWDSHLEGLLSVAKRSIVVGASVALLFAPWLIGPAWASTCTWDSSTATLSIAADSWATLTVPFDVPIFWVEGEDICTPSGATTSTVETIQVMGDAGGNVFRIDTLERFAPGAQPEGTGAPEIEFRFDLGDGDDQLTFLGAPLTAENLSFGTNGANLNNDDDVDVTFTGIESVHVPLGGESDIVSAAGDAVVGLPLNIPFIASGNHGDDTLIGGSANDVLEGGAQGDDDLRGGGGNDSLHGWTGADSLTGGAGRDLATYSGSVSAVAIDLAAGTASGEGSDALIGIENVVGSSNADKILGNRSPNLLRGGSGDDVINGRGGLDNLQGQAGRDRASFGGSPNKIKVSLASGTAAGWGNDSLSGIENATGSRFGDTIAGDLLGNRLAGGIGNDTIRGGRGSDLLHGNAGNDILNGGPGTDSCFQDAGTGSKTSCERLSSGGGGGGSGRTGSPTPGLARFLHLATTRRLQERGQAAMGHILTELEAQPGALGARIRRDVGAGSTAAATSRRVSFSINLEGWGPLSRKRVLSAR